LIANDVYLLLGSNIGNREAYLAKACELIGQQAGAVIKTSKLYETAAWGKTDQAPFLNQAIAVQTGLAPPALLSALKEIERQTGRTQTEKWGPRVIDIDILLYGRQVIQEPELQIPHPYLPVRRFALAPLAEIASKIVHPVLKKTIQALLDECPDESEVKVVGGC
jgi:2-amino-4-hydroxy-6-hydroxymethyldihydropteridine diphosphokinase